MPQQSMQARPLVSVITASKNDGAFIEETIQSVLAQDYPHIEHIVVDGVSTDGTLDILRRYPHLRWVSEPDGHTEAALRKGFAMSRGAIINHMFADDRFASPRAVSTAVEALEAHPEVKWVYGNYCTIDAHGHRMLQLGSRQVDYDHLLRNVHDIRGIQHQACFFRRELFEELGFLERKYAPPTDIELHLRFARKYPPMHVDALFADYRRHPGSYSATNTMFGTLKLAELVRLYAAGLPAAERAEIWASFARCSMTVTIIPVFIKTTFGEKNLHRLLAVRTGLEQRFPALRKAFGAVLGY